MRMKRTVPVDEHKLATGRLAPADSFETHNDIPDSTIGGIDNELLAEHLPLAVQGVDVSVNPATSRYRVAALGSHHAHRSSIDDIRNLVGYGGATRAGETVRVTAGSRQHREQENG